MENEFKNIFNQIEKNLLYTISDIEKKPTGAYNLRKNGIPVARNITSNIDIVSKQDKQGLNIIIQPNTKNETIHIPVILTNGGFTDIVHNDFYIGENADIVIISGCGIYNSSCDISQHDGIHTLHIGKRANVKYIEKHYGEGEGSGKKIFNPQTIIYLKDGSSLEIESVQIQGVSSTIRKTMGNLDNNTNLIITERIMTTENQNAKTIFNINLNGKNSSVHIASRSVSKNNSHQEFISNIKGNNKCFGHIECDAILMENSKVTSIPKIIANHIDANLIHEAAIRKNCRRSIN